MGEFTYALPWVFACCEAGLQQDLHRYAKRGMSLRERTRDLQQRGRRVATAQPALERLVRDIGPERVAQPEGVDDGAFW